MIAMQGTITENFARIESCISRANYGFEFIADWVEGKYELRNRFWCAITWKYYANDQMKWFLRKGENSLEKQPILLPWERHYRPTEFPNYLNFTDAIWVSDGHNPPSRREETVVRLLCEIEFTAITLFNELPMETNDAGATYRVFGYEFHFTSYGASVDIVVYANGDRLGGKNLTIDYEVSRARNPGRRKEWRAQPAAPGPEKKDALASTDDRDYLTVGPPSYTNLVQPQPAPTSTTSIRNLTVLQANGTAERLGLSS